MLGSLFTWLLVASLHVLATITAINKLTKCVSIGCGIANFCVISAYPLIFCFFLKILRDHHHDTYQRCKKKLWCYFSITLAVIIGRFAYLVFLHRISKREAGSHLMIGTYVSELGLMLLILLTHLYQNNESFSGSLFVSKQSVRIDVDSSLYTDTVLCSLLDVENPSSAQLYLVSDPQKSIVISRNLQGDIMATSDYFFPNSVIETQNVD